jgi:hypothetical protein
MVCLAILVTALISLSSNQVWAGERLPSDVNVVNIPTVNARQAGPWDLKIPGRRNRVTTSSGGVIPFGQTSTSVTLVVPTCPAGTNFLVTDVYAGPEVLNGSTPTDVVQLQNWAISVPVCRFISGSCLLFPLTALGNGPQAVSASIPAGQRIAEPPLVATILILGGGTAPVRFEFNVHLAGFCGVGFEQ